ncbi:MAG: FGGY-family carbohydrate kinase [Gemmiger sp.]|nr:FGGY-family carbohydrate kinase [Gemmiger sp.]
MQTMDWKQTALGIELGSTRIKAVLIGPDHTSLASGDYTWENRLENGYWTYPLAEVWQGIRAAYAALAAQVAARYGQPLTTVGGMGISAMMHGYLPFGADGAQLAPFRTWRNTTTGPAAQALTERFGFNIPQRWSIAHLYQAMLDNEAHLANLGYLTTLSGYVHWQLTGERVMGVGEAAGMFPIDSTTCDFDANMVESFDALAANYPWKLKAVLPRVLPAGERAGVLSPAGAALLDPTGVLQPGIPLCPPEGDAGTGMAATNSVAPCTGNVSAGTSVFAMVVLEKPLSKVYPELDMVTTPTGAPVAMVHCNTCTSDLNAWVGLLGEAAQALTGQKPDADTLYGTLYRAALKGEPGCGGLAAVNYFAGEPVTGLQEGRPLFVRMPDAALNLPNFMRAHLNAAIATLKIGMDMLAGEGVRLTTLLGHGGLFKTPVVGQQLLAGALNVPVACMETAGEGGPWGMALLAAYMANRQPGQTLERYLADMVFANAKSSVVAPAPADVAGFATYLQRYRAALEAEKAAVQAMP